MAIGAQSTATISVARFTAGDLPQKVSDSSLLTFVR
jgi:hypothetical protein